MSENMPNKVYRFMGDEEFLSVMSGNKLHQTSKWAAGGKEVSGFSFATAEKAVVPYFPDTVQDFLKGTGLAYIDAINSLGGVDKANERFSTIQELEQAQMDSFGIFKDLELGYTKEQTKAFTGDNLFDWVSKWNEEGDYSYLVEFEIPKGTKLKESYVLYGNSLRREFNTTRYDKEKLKPVGYVRYKEGELTDEEKKILDTYYDEKQGKTFIKINDTDETLDIEIKKNGKKEWAKKQKEILTSKEAFNKYGPDDDRFYTSQGLDPNQQKEAINKLNSSRKSVQSETETIEQLQKEQEEIADNFYQSQKEANQIIDEYHKLDEQLAEKTIKETENIEQKVISETEEKLVTKEIGESAKKSLNTKKLGIGLAIAGGALLLGGLSHKNKQNKQEKENNKPRPYRQGYGNMSYNQDLAYANGITNYSTGHSTYSL